MAPESRIRYSVVRFYSSFRQQLELYSRLDRTLWNKLVKEERIGFPDAYPQIYSAVYMEFQTLSFGKANKYIRWWSWGELNNEPICPPCAAVTTRFLLLCPY
jgi:hypothetical protein